jgi:hypothetical protein
MLLTRVICGFVIVRTTSTVTPDQNQVSLTRYRFLVIRYIFCLATHKVKDLCLVQRVSTTASPS